LIAAAISGCRTPERLEFIDDTEPPDLPTIHSVRSDGNRLYISVVQGEPQDQWISNLNAEVLSGDVYLFAVPSKVPVQTTEFSLDFSARRFPRDWKNRLYWITSYRAVTNMSTGVGHVTAVYRSKLTIQNEEKRPNKTSTANDLHTD